MIKLIKWLRDNLDIDLYKYYGGDKNGFLAKLSRNYKS